MEEEHPEKMVSRWPISLCSHRAYIGNCCPKPYLFSIIFIFYDVYFYKFLQFPCNCGIFKMMVIRIFPTVLSSQSFQGSFCSDGLFSGFLRLAGTIIGYFILLRCQVSYPTTAMDLCLECCFSYQADAIDNGTGHWTDSPFAYIGSSVVALLVFILLPFASYRYRMAFGQILHSAKQSRHESFFYI